MLQSLAAAAPGEGTPMSDAMKRHYESINLAVTNATINITNNLAKSNTLMTHLMNARTSIVRLEAANKSLSKFYEDHLAEIENHSSQENAPPESDKRKSNVAQRTRGAAKRPPTSPVAGSSVQTAKAPRGGEGGGRGRSRGAPAPRTKRDGPRCKNVTSPEKPEEHEESEENESSSEAEN